MQRPGALFPISRCLPLARPHGASCQHRGTRAPHGAHPDHLSRVIPSLGSVTRVPSPLARNNLPFVQRRWAGSGWDGEAASPWRGLKPTQSPAPCQGGCYEWDPQCPWLDLHHRHPILGKGEGESTLVPLLGLVKALLH